MPIHTSIARAAVTTVAVALFGVGLLTAAEMQIRAGDKILVLHDTHVQAGEEKLAAVAAGTELAATGASGEWIGVAVVRDGKTISGWISRNQLILVPALSFAFEADRCSNRLRFARLDRNQDGKLDFAEFSGSDGAVSARNDAQRAFALADLDHDGVLSQREFWGVSPEALLATLDRDGSQGVSEEEFLGGTALPTLDDFSRLAQSAAKRGVRPGLERELTSFGGWKRPLEFQEVQEMVETIRVTGDLRRSRRASDLLDPEKRTVQAHEAQVLFRWADRNGDGSLSVEELRMPFCIAPAGSENPSSVAAADLELTIAGILARRPPDPAKSVAVGIWLASPIVDRDLQQLQAVGEAIGRGKAYLAALATNDPALHVALATAVAKADQKCAVVLDGRKLMTPDLDAVAFLGFLNSQSQQTPYRPVPVSSNAVLSQVAIFLMATGKDIYVFQGNRPWTLNGNDLQLTSYVQVRKAVKDFARVAWYVGIPGGSDFGGFLEGVMSRVPGPGQIRPLEAKESFGETQRIELQPGWGVFQGAIDLKMIEVEGGKKMIVPFSGFHKVSGKVTWKRSDGSIKSLEVNAASPGSGESELRVFDLKAEGQSRGVVLLDFRYPENRTYYKGRIEELR